MGPLASNTVSAGAPAVNSRQKKYPAVARYERSYGSRAVDSKSLPMKKLTNTRSGSNARPSLTRIDR